MPICVRHALADSPPGLLNTLLLIAYLCVGEELPKQLLVTGGGVAGEADARAAGVGGQVAIHHGLFWNRGGWLRERVSGVDVGEGQWVGEGEGQRDGCGRGSVSGKGRVSKWVRAGSVSGRGQGGCQGYTASIMVLPIRATFALHARVITP